MYICPDTPILPRSQWAERGVLRESSIERRWAGLNINPLHNTPGSRHAKIACCTCLLNLGGQNGPCNFGKDKDW